MGLGAPWGQPQGGADELCGTPLCKGLGQPQVGQDFYPLVPTPCPPSIEIDQKLQEIMKQTGYLTIGGQVPRFLRFPTGRVGGTQPMGWARDVGRALWSPSPGFPLQRYQAEINDLENLGEMGSGTCGQVWKMRFRKTGHVIAVKVSPPQPWVVLVPMAGTKIPAVPCSKCGARGTRRRTSGSSWTWTWYSRATTAPTSCSASGPSSPM